jgi:hypothetical protein
MGQRSRSHYKYATQHALKQLLNLDENKNNSLLKTIIFIFKNGGR